MGMGTGGIPTTDNISETTEIFGFPTENIPDNRFFNLIRVYCRLDNRIFRLSRVYCRLNTRVFQLSRVYCQLWVSRPHPYPYPRKFSFSCMAEAYMPRVLLFIRLKSSSSKLSTIFRNKIFLKLKFSFFFYFTFWLRFGYSDSLELS